MEGRERDTSLYLEARRHADDVALGREALTRCVSPAAGEHIEPRQAAALVAHIRRSVIAELIADAESHATGFNYLKDDLAHPLVAFGPYSMGPEIAHWLRSLIAPTATEHRE